MAPPTPWTARARLSISGEVARPHTNDAAEKTLRPTAKTAPAVDVAGDARGQQERCQRQRIGVDYPLEVREARVQRELDVRQRHIHDGDVQQQHEHRSADRDQRPPFRSRTGIGGVYDRVFWLVQCGVIVGSGLTLEIGDRTLLAMRRSWWGRGRRSAWSGVTAPESPPSSPCSSASLRPTCAHSGNVHILGSSAICPRPRCRADSGSSGPAFSHVLSARGLDVLDDALGRSPPAMAEDASEENIELFTDLEEQFRATAATRPHVMAVGRRVRTASGAPARGHRRTLGWPAAPGRPHAGALPGARAYDPRRAHQPPGPFGQRWLSTSWLGSPARCSSSVTTSSCWTTPSPRCCTSRTSASRSGRAITRSCRPTRADQLQRERASQLEGPEISRLSTLADSMRASTEKRARKAKALDKRVERIQSERTSGRAPGASQQVPAARPAPGRRHAARRREARRPLRRQRGTGRHHLPRGPRRPHRRHRPQRRRQVVPVALPGRCPGAHERRDRARPQRHGRLLRPGARADRPRTHHVAERQ